MMTPSSIVLKIARYRFSLSRKASSGRCSALLSMPTSPAFWQGCFVTFPKRPSLTKVGDMRTPHHKEARLGCRINRVCQAERLLSAMGRQQTLAIAQKQRWSQARFRRQLRADHARYSWLGKAPYRRLSKLVRNHLVLPRLRHRLLSHGLRCRRSS